MKNVIENNTDKRLELLRELLLKDEREKIDNLSDEILLKESFTSRVDGLIDEKIKELHATFPEKFGKIVTETIKIQTKESQEEVVEALYPVIGKIIKKSITVEISKLSQSINKTLKQKFSFLDVVKRFFKGKKSDASVVLQEVFEPIIEEVFIIEKDSGLLSGSYSRNNNADKDMVSGMLTAIKSFAEDAFSKKQQNLEDIKFETFQLSIHNFKTIYIAIAASGILSLDFKDELLDNVNNLAGIILRNRSYLDDEIKLNKLIIHHLIKEEQK